MRSRPPLPVALLLVVASCHRAGFLPAREVGPGDAAQLAVGHSAAIRETGVRFRVDDISDSRCPVDVRCISAGDVVVVVSFTGSGAGRTDTLHLMRAPRVTTYGRNQIELLDVQPAPRSVDDRTPRIATLAVTDRP
jgi:hypothetical protein